MSVSVHCYNADFAMRASRTQASSSKMMPSNMPIKSVERTAISIKKFVLTAVNRTTEKMLDRNQAAPLKI
eukprot:6225459-Amphidinium_carterae.1